MGKTMVMPRLFEPGRLITNGVILKEHEMMTVNYFLGRGIDIELVPKSNKAGEHKPDIWMLGLYWEIKCPKGQGKYLIQNTLHKAAHQAENVIVDLRRVKLHPERATRELKKVFGDLRSIKRLKVITKTGEMLDFVK